ncbi:MAG TPA: YggT family protein [Acidimicrobiales bacterium]|nr:YggT family protein [Acidimicrobiales bacterium]
MTAAVLAVNAGLQRALSSLLWLYTLVLIGRAVISWFPITPGTPLETVARVLERLTEPLLRPIRRILPPVRAGGMAIDLSIIVAILGLGIVGPIIISAL